MAIFDGAPAPKRSHAVLGNRSTCIGRFSCLKDDMVMLKG